MIVNNIIIELARPQDAAILAQTEGECFSTPWALDMIAQEITGAQSRVWCAKTPQKKIVGHIAITFATDTADITTVAVLPQYRRLGIAASLLEKVVSFCEANGTSTLFLEVRESNAAAIALYEKYQFEKISVRRNYYKQPTEDAVIYRKEMQNENS